MAYPIDSFVSAFDLLKVDQMEAIKHIEFKEIQGAKVHDKSKNKETKVIKESTHIPVNNIKPKTEVIPKPKHVPSSSTKSKLKSKDIKATKLKDYSKVKYDYKEVKPTSNNKHRATFVIEEGKLVPVNQESNEDLNNGLNKASKGFDIKNKSNPTNLNIKKENHHNVIKTSKKVINPKSEYFKSKEEVKVITKEKVHTSNTNDVKETVIEQKADSELTNSNDNNDKQKKKDKETSKKDKVKKELECYYKEHLNPDKLKEEIEHGTCLIGKIRINSFNRSHCYIVVENRENDVFVLGTKARNRALEGDEIIVKLFSSEDKQDFFKNNKEVPKTVIERDLDVGEVVSILNSKQDRVFIGNIKEIKQKEKKSKRKDKASNNDENKKDVREVNTNNKLPKYLEFKPCDAKVPLILIETSTISKEYLNDMKLLFETYFAVEISSWNKFIRNPKGKIKGTIGNLNDINSVSNCILIENNINIEDELNTQDSHLPNSIQDILNNEDIDRVDLRSKCIFTIDPPSAKDLDDALSIEVIDEQTYLIGVHIADVASFIKENSKLDLTAKQKATTIYLVEKNIPMLPRKLSEELCSLTPNKDRLAFTIQWKINKQGQILDTKYFKSIINSCVKLSYQNVQLIIENHQQEELNKIKHDIDNNINNKFNFDLIKNNILNLFNLSKILRTERFDEGSLEMGSLKLNFNLDSNNSPISCNIYKSIDANKLVEEFMLLANKSIAEFLTQHLPEHAFLRYHPSPNEKGLQELVLIGLKYNINLDTANSKTLSNTMTSINNSEILEAMRILSIHSMQRAKYMCNGYNKEISSNHYALNMLKYTHFTSPIRRYADIIVHRQLESILYNKKYNSINDIQELNQIATHCNNQRDKATRIQDLSQLAYLAHYLNNFNITKEKAKIINFNEEHIVLVVTHYALDAKISIKNLALNSFELKQDKLILNWKCNSEQSKHNQVEDNENKDKQVIHENNNSRIQELKLLDYLDVQLRVDIKRFPPAIEMLPINPTTL